MTPRAPASVIARHIASSRRSKPSSSPAWSTMRPYYNQAGPSHLRFNEQDGDRVHVSDPYDPNAPYASAYAVHGWREPPFYPPYRPPSPSGGARPGPSSRSYGRPVDSWRPANTPPAMLPPFPPTLNNAASQTRSYHSGSPRSGGAYTPPHPRNRHNDRDKRDDRASTPPSASREGRTKSKKKGNFRPHLPPAEYIKLSQPSAIVPSEMPRIVPKLLVLDLNGALIYRSGSRGTERSIYPRPYLGNFLEYLFGPNGKEGEPRAYEVFVWSSAQPHNVRAMVENGFGQKWVEGVYAKEEDGGAERRKNGEGRLMGVWARDKMELSSSDYNNNVQTFKDLRKIIAHVADEPSPGREPHTFDEKRVILLDDSPLKAVNQPWNQLVIPEFDRDEHQGSRDAINHPRFKHDDPLESMDRILLAVIGILDELSTVENVPAWVRSGGLIPDLNGLENGVRRLSLKRQTQPTLEDLPSFEGFAHWYTIPAVQEYWAKRGLSALEKRGIEVDHGLDAQGYRKGQFSKTQPARPSPEHGASGNSSPARRWESPQPQFERRRKAWSPSRPADWSEHGSLSKTGGTRSRSPSRSSPPAANDEGH